MKKFFKIPSITLAVIVILYCIAIPIFRSDFVLHQKDIFTPTPYQKDSISEQIKDANVAWVSKDSVQLFASKSLASKAEISFKLNHVDIQRKFINGQEYFDFKPEKVDRTVIYFLGNTANVFSYIDDFTELAKSRNIEIFVPVYSINGFSQEKGELTTQFKLNQDFLNFVEKTAKVDVVIGHSLGTVFATNVAVDNKIPELVLLAPVSNTQDVIKNGYMQLSGILYPLRPFFDIKVGDELLKNDLPKRLNLTKKIKPYQGKLLIFHGTKDENLAFFMGENLFKSSSAPQKEFIRIENGDHDAAFEKSNWQNLMQKL